MRTIPYCKIYTTTFLLFATLLSGCGSKGSGDGSGGAKQNIDPTANSCFDPAALPARGQEISVSQFIDGHGGVYRLTALTGMTFNYNSDVSAGISTSAETDIHLNHPKLAAMVTCKNFSETPTGLVEGTLSAPMIIQRDSGVFENYLETKYTIGGPDSYVSDQVDAVQSDTPKTSNIEALKALLPGSGLELHIYQLNPTSYQLLISGKLTIGYATYAVRSSAIYVYQGGGAVTPAPAPAPAPVHPGPIASPEVNKICMGYSYNDDRVSCLLKLKGKSFDKDVLDICTGYSYRDDQVNCLLKLEGLSFPPDVVSTCKGYSYNDDRVACLLKFKP